MRTFVLYMNKPEKRESFRKAYMYSQTRLHGTHRDHENTLLITGVLYNHTVNYFIGKD